MKGGNSNIGENILDTLGSITVIPALWSSMRGNQKAELIVNDITNLNHYMEETIKSLVMLQHFINTNLKLIICIDSLNKKHLSKIDFQDITKIIIHKHEHPDTLAEEYSISTGLSI